MDMRDHYNLYFDLHNRNRLIIEDKISSIIVTSIAIPPTENGIDLIIIGDGFEEIQGYVYNFKGLVIITNEEGRFLYYRGDLLDEID